MTQKDFQEIASLLASTKPQNKNGQLAVSMAALAQWQVDCSAVAWFLAKNPNLDELEFIHACNITESR